MSDKGNIWEPLPVQYFPEPLRSYAQSHAAGMGCEPALFALPLLAAAAAAIGDTRRMAWHFFPLRLWVMVRSPSGTHKSPALHASLRFYRRCKHEANNQPDAESTVGHSLAASERLWRSQKIPSRILHVVDHASRVSAIRDDQACISRIVVMMYGKLRQRSLLSNFLVASPPRLRSPLPNRWADLFIPEELNSRMQAVFDTLFGFKPDIGKSGLPIPRTVNPSPAAKNLLEAFSEKTIADFARQEPLEATLAVAEMLGLVHHCVRVAACDLTVGNPDVMDEVSAASGVAMTEWFANEAKRLQDL